MDVDRLLLGALPGADAVIRQLTPRVDADSEDTPLLEAGKVYVVFLEPFEFTSGKGTGQWVVARDVGLDAVEEGRVR